jgi:hypothetical protein
LQQKKPSKTGWIGGVAVKLWWMMPAHWLGRLIPNQWPGDTNRPMKGGVLAPSVLLYVFKEIKMQNYVPVNENNVWTIQHFSCEDLLKQSGWQEGNNEIACI